MMKPENIVLSSNTLSISRLIHNLDKIEFSILQQHLQELNISNVQALVIIYLYNSEKEVFQKDLEIAFGVTNPTMTVSIKSMQNKGLIVKEKSQVDGRYYRLSLTEKGYGLYPKCFSIYTKIENLHTTILTDEEYQTLSQLIHKLIDGLIDKNND